MSKIINVMICYDCFIVHSPFIMLPLQTIFLTLATERGYYVWTCGLWIQHEPDKIIIPRPCNIRNLLLISYHSATPAIKGVRDSARFFLLLDRFGSVGDRRATKNIFRNVSYHLTPPNASPVVWLISKLYYLTLNVSM